MENQPMKSPRIMYAYAGLLIVMSVLAWVLSGFTARGATAFIAAGMGLIMVLCGYMASMIHRQRIVGMIGVHAGLALPLVYTGMFGWLAYGRFTAEEPVLYLAWIFAIMAAGSAAAFVAILLTRPKPEART